MHGFRACKHSVYFSLNPKFTTMFVKNFQIYDVQIFKKCNCESKIIIIKKSINIFTQALQQNPLPDSYHHHRKERNYSVLARQHFLKTCPLWGSFSSNISKNEFSAKIRLCYLLDHTIMKLHERITKKIIKGS